MMMTMQKMTDRLALSHDLIWTLLVYFLLHLYATTTTITTTHNSVYLFCSHRVSSATLDECHCVDHSSTNDSVRLIIQTNSEVTQRRIIFISFHSFPIRIYLAAAWDFFLYFSDSIQCLVHNKICLYVCMLDVIWFYVSNIPKWVTTVRFSSAKSSWVCSSNNKTQHY